MNHTFKHVLDLIAAILAFISVAIPTIITTLAALASLVWYGIRINEWWKEKKSGNK